MCFVGAFDFYRCGCHPGQQNWVRPLEVRVFIISKKFIKMMENIFQYYGEDISRWCRIYFKMMEVIFQDYGEYISRWWKRYFQMIKNIFQVEKVTGVATGLRLDPAKLTQSTLHCAWVNIGSQRTAKVWFKTYLAVIFLEPNDWGDLCLLRPQQLVIAQSKWLNKILGKIITLVYSCQGLDFKTSDLALDVRLITLDSRPWISSLSVEFTLTVHW